MKRYLVTYATMAGSTAEVARMIADEISGSGFEVDTLPIEAVRDLERYAGVVVGAPMKWRAVLFGMLVIRAPAGDRRNASAQQVCRRNSSGRNHKKRLPRRRSGSSLVFHFSAGLGWSPISLPAGFPVISPAEAGTGSICPRKRS